MLYLLDTNALVALRRKNPVLISKLKSHSPSAICYSDFLAGGVPHVI